MGKVSTIKERKDMISESRDIMSHAQLEGASSREDLVVEHLWVASASMLAARFSLAHPAETAMAPRM